MAIHSPPPLSQLLTYERYMAEEQVEGRYDILDGIQIFLPGASWRHQRISGHIMGRLRQFEEQSSIGFVLSSPFDVMIRRNPLRTRQPDILFISRARLEQSGGIPEDGPLEVAPEIVVEIISDSETERRFGEKVADYITIGVGECWRVRPDARTVEVFRLTPNGPESVAVYGEADTLQSITFSDLTLAVADFFAL